ncbi:MAG TPA: PAS domain S-box protein [Candidatus Binatia bacterium]|nr:PAS domain S-box protein [Candidatus Binatia bacterium]
MTRASARVVLLDGAAASRRRAARALERGGFSVSVSSTVAETLRLSGAVHPHVIVLDLDGLGAGKAGLWRRLAAERGATPAPVVILSASMPASHRRAAGRHGPAAYLAKPYRAIELVSTVKSLVRLREAETALRARDSLLAIAGAVGGTLDLTEALRVVCRELARLTGAETVGAHLLVREQDELRPVAGYHIPKDALDVLAGSPVPRQPFWPAVMRAGEVVWSDDVGHDERFAFPLFRGVPHQSGAVIPLIVDGEVAGTFYLVWWQARHRVEPAEALLLQTIGRQVGLLVRSARLIEDAEMRRRLAEAARQHYQHLFDRNLAGVFRATRDGRVLECNEAFARLLGYRSPAETARHDVWGFLADAAEREPLLERLAGERRVTNHEMRWRRRSGEDVAVMANITLTGAGAGAVLEGIVLDISERKRAADALRERETQLRHLGDNLPEGVIYQVVRRRDGSNYFAYMSSGLERTFGLRPGEALSNPDAVYRLILPADLVRLRAAADASIRTGNPFDVECRLRAPDGTERWLNIRGRPSPLADGATQWDAVALDITGRKRAEEALREQESQLRSLAEDLRRSEERYRRLFERSFVGIFRTRPDGIVLECNDAFARILGGESAAEMRGRSVLGYYATPADRDVIVARIAAGEEVVDAELTGRRRDGSPVPVAMSVRRVVDRDGPVHEGILVDLTDRKAAAEAHALRSVAELANAAAHEINNPLSVILGQLDLLRRDQTDLAQRIEVAQAAVLRIRDIVSHMTRITRLETSTGWSPSLPRMLDLRRSGESPDTA